MVPRLRDAETTARLGELDSVSAPALRHEYDPAVLENKAQEWRNNPTISFAADLVSAALVLGRAEYAQDAAQYLLSESVTISPSAREVAQRILASTKTGIHNPNPSTAAALDPIARIASIKRSRQRLNADPRNAIAWADMARGYLNVGMLEKAKNAMHAARILAPSNRFILRSSSRLLIHCGDRDEAHDLLKTAEAVKTDPWLLSAEIAASTLAERKSRLVRVGRQILLSERYSPFHMGELASAIATLETHSGNNKAARKLFELALKQPTENSIAQAEWATTQLNDFRIGKHLFQTPYSHEANARYAFNSEAWDDALTGSWKWLFDEPFSSQPAVFGSFIAADVLEDYTEGERIARQGLLANKNDPGLLNNLAFSLANLGKLDEAVAVIAHVKPADLQSSSGVCLLATRGLIAYRAGNIVEGRAHYLQAIEEARRQKFDKLRARASLYLAYEELRSNSPTIQSALQEALELCLPINETDIRHALRRLKKTLEMKGESTSALLPSLDVITKHLNKGHRRSYVERNADSADFATPSTCDGPQNSDQ